ncbi:hypothetical protein HY480_03445 [Candidatus Uhrbacteria bacterium]|nr:hypothetical protein [Candidatus Uhrbacteria bacterium]
MMEAVSRTLTPDEVERLNACMRPSDGIRQKKLVIVLALLRELEALESEDLQRAALMHMFDAYGYAYFSGPQTPAHALPEPPAAGSPEEHAFLTALNDADRRDFTIASMQLCAGAAPVPGMRSKDGIDVVLTTAITEHADIRLECAHFALRLLREDTTRERRGAHLALLLGSPVFVPRSQPPAIPRSGSPIDDADYHIALGRNRAAIRKALWCLPIEGSHMTSNPQIGGSLLNVLSHVVDPRDRACVLGFIIEQWKSCPIRNLALGRGDPISSDPWDDSTVDSAYYEDALWRNRAVAREAFWCLPGIGSLNTKASQVGGMLLDVLSRIADPRDRACVLGFIIEQWKSCSVEELCGRRGIPVSVDIIPDPVEARDRSLN